jgi:trans-aconitate 2-methyltransferase
MGTLNGRRPAGVGPVSPGRRYGRVVSGTDGSAAPGAAWDPTTYLRYAGERARPFADLLARVRHEAPSVVVDLGCGEGALTASLAHRWPAARVIGVDSSAEMLAAAHAHAVPERVSFELGDLRDWRATRPVDVLVSNAAMHWVPGHADLLRRWAAELAPGGELAVQVPGNFRAPTHTLLTEICRSPRWSARVAAIAPRPDAVLEPVGYLDVLTDAGLDADVWETTYLHVLRGADPVLGWVRGTVLRPVLAELDAGEAEELTTAYAAALRSAYPERPDGTTVLPFRRIFVVGRRGH